jgi:hypothetical protein
MRRQLSLIALVALSALASACAAPTGPVNNDDKDPCVVVVGTQTRCEGK